MSWKDLPGGPGRSVAFDEEHEAEGPARMVDGWLYYPDGAKREAHPLGAMHDAPSDPLELARAKARYHKIEYQSISQKFRRRKDEIEALLRSISHAPPNIRCTAPISFDEDALVAELEELRGKVRKAHRRWMRSREAIEQATPEARKKIERTDAAHRAEAGRILAKINSIDL